PSSSRSRSPRRRTTGSGPRRRAARRAGSLRELGDRLMDLLGNLEDESASVLVELARLSRLAPDRSTLLELARTSLPPDDWFRDDGTSTRAGGRRAMATALF